LIKSGWLILASTREALASAAIGSVRAVSTLQNVTDEIEFAVIAAPNGLHFALARDALYAWRTCADREAFVLTPERRRDLQEVATANDRTIAINKRVASFRLL